MKELLIIGSSYLIPNNKEWSSNLGEYAISFSEYGDWNSLITKRKEQDILLVVLLEDLISEDANSDTNLEEKLNPFLLLLEKSLQDCKSPIILSISDGNNFDPIRYAKGKYYMQKAFNWMLHQLEELGEKYNHFYIINLKDAFAQIGVANAFDNRNLYFAHCRLSAKGIKHIARNAGKVYQRHYDPPAKVLVLDCDNTIWGGVIGEDKLNGIVLGQDGIGEIFVDFQKEVKRLINQGVIVALSSKNNETEVWEVFDKHKSMVLSRKDIVAWRINWNEKSQNIKEIASELDLSINSFIFWDDNPVERDKMKAMAPEVMTVNAPTELYEWPSLLRSLFELAKFDNSLEDANKTELYHKRANFVRDSHKSIDEISYLKSIKLDPISIELDQSNIQRAAQLCSKTNQFNLRTIRHSAEDLLEINKNNHEFCFLVSLDDIYGSHGIVGLVCIKQIDDDNAFLDTFLMSCRVLGRHLESWMLREAINRCKNKQIRNLIGGFINSDRNVVAKSFFTDHSFILLDQDNGKVNKSVPVISNEVLYKISTEIDDLPFGEIYE